MMYVDLVSLWIGRIFLGFVALLFAIFVAICIFQCLKYLLRRPWQCISHLMPWKWSTEKNWQSLEKGLAYRQKRQDTEYLGAELIRKNKHFGIMYFPHPTHWWQPKNHYFIIKG